MLIGAEYYWKEFESGLTRFKMTGKCVTEEKVALKSETVVFSGICVYAHTHMYICMCGTCTYVFR